MNLPNKLTLLRVILIPFFLLFIYIDIPFNFLFALIIFAAASITDARKAFFSSACTPAMVVPPGEHTLSLSCSGCSA